MRDRKADDRTSVRRNSGRIRSRTGSPARRKPTACRLREHWAWKRILWRLQRGSEARRLLPLSSGHHRRDTGASACRQAASPILSAERRECGSGLGPRAQVHDGEAAGQTPAGSDACCSSITSSVAMPEKCPAGVSASRPAIAVTAEKLSLAATLLRDRIGVQDGYFQLTS